MRRTSPKSATRKLLEYLPLKQGLRLSSLEVLILLDHLSPRVSSSKTRIKTALAPLDQAPPLRLPEYLPVKQGLRQRFQNLKYLPILLRPEYLPVKQGLRLLENTDDYQKNRLLEYLPLKQGLTSHANLLECSKIHERRIAIHCFLHL